MKIGVDSGKLNWYFDPDRYVRFTSLNKKSN